MAIIAPSILAADFAQLRDEINSVASAEYLHFDVMDGLFVPNISFGLPILESVRRITDKTLDVHLMITAPARYIARFAKAGADIVTFHLEAEAPDAIAEAIHELHKMGKKAGLSIKPGTAAAEIMPYLELIDQALVMTVEPGFGGQKFMADMLPKIVEIRNVANARNLKCDIEVDGGINIETARLCVEAGANILVAGNEIFKSQDREATIEALREEQARRTNSLCP